MKRLTLSFLLLFPLLSLAQRVQIKKIELAGEKIIVHYELDDSNPNNEYQLNLFTSKDNFTVPMNKVTGDIGNEIKAGTTKKLEWKFKEELNDYQGDLALEIRGRVFVMFAKLQDFDEDKTYKRGKTYPLTWKPGNTNPVHIELFKGSERVVGELNHPNNGSYQLTMPSHAKPGDDYRIRLSDSKRSGEYIFTDLFKVRPKIPLLVKIAGGAAVLGGIVFVAASSGGETPSEPTGIPEPLPLPENN